jgi:hypothetical protein
MKVRNKLKQVEVSTSSSSSSSSSAAAAAAAGRKPKTALLLSHLSFSVRRYYYTLK